MSRLLPAVLVACAAATLAAQTTPTFRTGANYIRVDMYATRDGRVVDDLRPEEVEVLEDGTPQKVEAFEHIVIRPAGPDDTRVEPQTVAESREMARDPRARVFVIFLDTMHTQLDGTANMRLPLVRFLDRVLGQDDLVAIMTPEMSASDLTLARKTAVISSIMRNEQWGRRGTLNLDEKEELYRSCYPDLGQAKGVAAEMKERRREQLTLDALEDLVRHLGGIREERKAVLTVTEGWVQYGADRQLARRLDDFAAPPDTFGRRPRDVSDRGRTASAVMMRECDADRMRLALTDNRLRLREIAEDANRANVTFYPVYARGLAAFDAPMGPDRPPRNDVDATRLSSRQDGLRQLAEDTDGIAIIATNRMNEAMTRIVDDLSSYYLLSYYSSNTKPDGRFRNITVRVKRPGVQVRARRGYRGLTAEELVSAERAEKRAAAAGSRVAVVVNPRAPFRIRAATWTSPSSPDAAAVWVVGELDYATRKELAWSAGATAEVTVVAGDGREVVSSYVPVPAGDGTFTIRVPESGGIAPGEYALRVRVRPETDPGLPVQDTARLSVPSAGAVLGEPVMWRRGPSTGLKHLATADPRFRRNERLRFEMATEADGVATARMLDRAGNPLKVPVQVSARPDESGAFRWIVTDVTLAPLAMGDYGIEVTLAGAKQVAAFKVVP